MNTSVHFSSKTDLWATPIAFFQKLNMEFGFTLDPCATDENAKCKKYYTKEQDGLVQNWDGEIVFCNPPYGREVLAWVEKASMARGGGSSNALAGENGYAMVSRSHIP
jgi:phage N-6-adenine-methyltransferase